MLSMALDYADEIEHADWIEADLPWVERADAVLRLPGYSEGAGIECRHASRYGAPIYCSVEDLIDDREQLIARRNAKREVADVEAYDREELGTIIDSLNGSRGNDQYRLAERGLKWLTTVLKKNRDYGSSAWERPILAPECSPRVGIRVRMSDKIRRLETLLANPAMAEVCESIDDTFTDLAAYGLLYAACPVEDNQP
jgi:hypothetical protein